MTTKTCVSPPPDARVNLPSEAKSYIVCVDVDSGAWVEQRSCLQHEEAGSLMKCLCTAIRTSFPGCPLDWGFHGTFGVDELEDRVEDEPQDHTDFRGVAEFESEIEATVGALEPIEESDAVEVLAVWKENQDCQDTGKAQSRAPAKPTPKQHVNHQERFKTRSCGVGWSHSVS